MKALPIRIRNAVLNKDLQVRARRDKFPVLIFIVNIILSIVVTVILLSINSSIFGYGSVPNSLMTGFFIGCIIYSSALICLVVPPVSANTISGEREHQTLDVLLTTSMSPFEIVFGKYMTSIIYMALFLLSTLPALCIACIYGGINLLQIVAVLISVIIMAMYFAAFGVYFSAAVKKSSSATVLTFLIIGISLFGTITIVALIYVAVSAHNSMLYVTPTQNPHYWSADPFMFLLYLNPMCTVFDAVGRIVGFPVDTPPITGMDYIMKNVASSFPQSNILVRFWTPLSCAVQLFISGLMLKASANKLDPFRIRDKKRKWKKKRS